LINLSVTQLAVGIVGEVTVQSSGDAQFTQRNYMYAMVSINASTFFTGNAMIRSTNLLFSTLCVVAAMLSTAKEIQAQTAATFELPQAAGAWINSEPVSVSGMRGKSIVLYFFEEGCPRCREKWPSIIAASQQLQGKPVMLVAVNSGNSAATVARYARENKLSIPIIVDSTRQLEQAAGVGSISLQNIYQAATIGPQGDVRRSNAQDLLSTLQAAADESSWNVDPANIPAPLIPLWKQIEFGNFTGTGKLIARRLQDRKPEIKQAVEALNNYAKQQIQQRIERAADATANDNLWLAYQIKQNLTTEFAGYDLPETLEQEIAELEKDPSIRNEIEAMKLWNLVVKAMSTGTTPATRLSAMCNRITTQFPGTEAANLASQAISNTPQ
jgi:peroxiredoxin